MKKTLLLVGITVLVWGCAHTKEAGREARIAQIDDELNRRRDKDGFVIFKDVSLNTFTQIIPSEPAKRTARKIEIRFGKNEMRIGGKDVEPFLIPYSEIERYSEDITKDKMDAVDVIMFGVFSSWMFQEASKEGWVVLDRTGGARIFLSLPKKRHALFKYELDKHVDVASAHP